MSLKMLGRRLGWLIVGALLLANLMVGARLYSQEVAQSERDDAYDNIHLFTRVLELIRENYVDQDKTSYKDLVYGALQGMLQSLDPHSQFMDKEAYTEMKDDTAGQFGGLGIVITIRDAVLTIVAPMEDTPGFRAGLLSGDRIIEIDGKSTEGMNLSDAVKKLRGEPGTKVSIKILRPKTQELKVVELERAEIKVASVKDDRILEAGIGYVRITQFNDPTGDALQQSLEHLMTNDLKALIVDLRNNPGGLLSSAIEVSQKFLPRNDVIVSTQGRDRKQEQTFRARGKYHYTGFPMVVLINGGSASAAEIVAGALQDHKRAVLVGEKSFGKGSVQSVLPCDDGTAIRLTTAKYYTPNKRSIHEKGIEPDIVVPMDPENWRKLMIQRAHEEAPESDELKPPAEEKVEDIQLQRAVDVLKGIMMFTSNDPRNEQLQLTELSAQEAAN